MLPLYWRDGYRGSSQVDYNTLSTATVAVLPFAEPDLADRVRSARGGSRHDDDVSDHHGSSKGPYIPDIG